MPAHHYPGAQDAGTAPEGHRCDHDQRRGNHGVPVGEVIAAVKLWSTRRSCGRVK
jgi:hypothetical protein